MPLEEVWQIMSTQLQFIHHAYEIKILAFVLMSNHFHLIAQSPRMNMSEGMRWFMGETSRGITKSADRINQTFGGRHFQSLLSTYLYFQNAYKYLYLNPVRAGMVKRVEDYPFSTLSGLLGQRHIHIPIEEDFTLFSNVSQTLEWLNRPVKDAHWEVVRKALRHKEFKFPKKGVDKVLLINAM